MTVFWEAWLRNPAGDRVAVFESFPHLVINARVNAPGAYALELAGNDTRIPLFELDGQLEFWRVDTARSIPRYLVFEGLHCDSEDAYDADGIESYISSGPGYNQLLRRRIIAAYSGSVEAAKDGPAETVIKDFVEEQCGATAGARAIAGLIVDLPSGGTGNPVRLARAYRYVLDVCQEIAAIGGGDFAVVGTGGATYQFQWYLGQLGADRSATVIFAIEWGNMGRPRLVRRRTNEVNAVLVGGQGDGVARTTVWRTDPTRIADSPINRRELFIDQRQDADTDGLNFTGDRALDDGQSPYQLTFDVLQVPSCLYGLHYFLGDLVTVKFKTYSAVQEVVGLDFVVDGNGEQIKVILADPPAEYGT